MLSSRLSCSIPHTDPDPAASDSSSSGDSVVDLADDAADNDLDMREPLVSVLHRPTPEPIFILPRAWTSIHLRLLRCRFSPASSAPLCARPIGPLTKREHRLGMRLLGLVTKYKFKDSIGSVVKDLLRWTSMRRPRLQILGDELSIYTILGKPCVGLRLYAFALPGEDCVGIICVNYKVISAIRANSTETLLHRQNRKDQRTLTVPMRKLELARPKTKQDKFEDPFIATMLISIAQERLQGLCDGDNAFSHVLILHDDSSLHLYTAFIPRALSEWLQAPRTSTAEASESSSRNQSLSDAPGAVRNWPMVNIARLEIPPQPYETFGTRLIDAIHSERNKF